MDDARIFHVNVNCSDLERSRRFYEALGLNAAARTSPEHEQPGSTFGLGRARWDAWILVGARGFDGGAVDLLEWKQPLPTGAPPSSFVTTGLQRMGVAVADLDTAIAGAIERGGTVLAPPHAHDLADGATVRLVMAADPDGTAIELIEGRDTRLSFVAVGCADLDASTAFYERLGFREVGRFSPAPDDASHLGIDGPARFDEVMLAAPAGGEVHLVLVGFTTPPVEAASARPANAIGMWRIAMFVADLGAASRQLSELGIDTMSQPVTMDMGPGLPALRFVCFAGPDHEVLELIEQPQ